MINIKYFIINMMINITFEYNDPIHSSKLNFRPKTIWIILYNLNI